MFSSLSRLQMRLKSVRVQILMDSQCRHCLLHILVNIIEYYRLTTFLSGVKVSMVVLSSLFILHSTSLFDQFHRRHAFILSRPNESCLSLCSPVFSDIPKKTAVFEVSQASPACPSDKKSIKMKLRMYRLWNHVDRTKLNTAE
jgi:hypothetical protein